MAHPRLNATGHVIYDEGEKILSSDLEYMGAMAEQAVLHLFGRLVEGAAGTPISGFIGDDCKVTASGLTATIAAGWGFWYDSAASSAFTPHYKPIVVATSTTQAINAHHATLERWDLLSLRPNAVEDQSATRNVKDLITLDVASQTVNKRVKWSYTLTYTAGTASATPSTPATPSGDIAIARIRVPATAGAVTVDDLRPIVAIQAASASEPGVDYATNFVGNYVPLSWTDLQVTESSTPSMVLQVADGEAVIQGARYRYGYQTVTVTAAHATLERIDLVVADADGTLQVLAGTPGGAPASVASDQVLLATVTIPATDTAIGSAQIVDGRVGAPYDGATHVQADSLGAAQLTTTTKPVRAALTAGAEAANHIDVVVALADSDGNTYSRTTKLLARLYSATMETVAAADWGLSEVGAGSSVSTSGGTGLIISTDSTGAATIRVQDDTGAFAGNVYLVVHPIDVPAVFSYVVLTFA